MRSINKAIAIGALTAVAVLGPLPNAFGWGEDGHRFTNRVAADHLPGDMPAFFRNASDRLAYLGPEPDRWRSGIDGYSAINAAAAPDHFIDIDNPADFAALPDDRYQYAEGLRARGKDPKAVGFLPYAILEGYEKLQILFRLWRDPANATERDQIEQNIIYTAGVMGHYVADGSQPLHSSNHYNGWSGSNNPDQFTREPLHWRFENDFVKANIKAGDFSQMVKPPVRMGDPFSSIMNYLLSSRSQVPELYRMDKTARWDALNHEPASKAFVCNRLAAGSQMLANLWYTAWLASAASENR